MPISYGFHVVIEMNENFMIPTKLEILNALSEIEKYEIIVVSLERKTIQRSNLQMCVKRFHLFVKSDGLTLTRLVIEFVLDKYFSSKLKKMKTKNTIKTIK